MMAEPVTLYHNDEVLIVAAPSEVQRLLAEGWTQNPWDFERVASEDPAPVETEVAPKRGRPKKA